MSSPDEPALQPSLALNVFFDVDHTLVYIDQHSNVLRPGAGEPLMLTAL